MQMGIRPAAYCARSKRFTIDGVEAKPWSSSLIQASGKKNSVKVLKLNYPQNAEQQLYNSSISQWQKSENGQGKTWWYVRPTSRVPATARVRTTSTRAQPGMAVLYISTLESSTELWKLITFVNESLFISLLFNKKSL